jgi:hypothetical protein
LLSPHGNKLVKSSGNKLSRIGLDHRSQWEFVETGQRVHVNLPAHRGGLPGKVSSLILCPLTPPTCLPQAGKAGLAGHLPVNLKHSEKEKPQPKSGLFNNREGVSNRTPHRSTDPFPIKMVPKGGFEPPRGLPTTPSRWRVYQFHHFGVHLFFAMGTITSSAPLRGPEAEPVFERVLLEPMGSAFLSTTRKKPVLPKKRSEEAK